MQNTIKVTGVDLRLLIAAAYDLSKPQGLGVIHFQEGPISDGTIDDVLSSYRITADGCVLSMDYVLGRAVKLNLWKRGDDLFIDDKWFDHSEDDLRQLLERLDIEIPENL